MKNVEASWLSFMTFVIGIALWTIWTDIPFITLDKSFSLSDLTGIILTAFIALFYANWIQKRFEDTKNNKQLIIEELGDLCLKIESIWEKMRVCVGRWITESEIREIMDIKSIISNDILSLEMVLKKNFWLLTDGIWSRLRGKYFTFSNHIDPYSWKVITEEEFRAFWFSRSEFIKEVRFIKSEITSM